MITKEGVHKYFQSDFISDLDGYFVVSDWQRSEETPFGVSDDTHFINLYQRNSNSTITPVCYSWKTTECDLIFSGIFAYLYVAQKSICKIAGKDAMLAFCEKFSFPALRDFSPNGYFDIVTALKEANLAPTKNESVAYSEMLNIVVSTLQELVFPFILQYDYGEDIVSLIEPNVAKLYKWVANTKDELISFYGVLMRKEYSESGYYETKYFPLDCLVNTLQNNGVYSWQELAKKPIQNDSPLPNYDRLDNPIVAHYGDIEFIINYNNREKEEEWYLKEETPEEEKQRDLYNILINTLWEDEKYCENGKYGIKDCRGRVILPAEYDDCLGGLSSAAYISPEEMIIAVKQNGKWGFVKRNSALEQVVSFKYDSIEDTLNGVYITNIGELYGIIGKRGIEILPTIMEDIYQPSFDGHIIYKQDGKYGFRLKNKSRSTELFDEVNLDSEEYLSVCRNGEWGYIVASTLLAKASDIIQATEKCDVTAFRNWLLADPTKPLICIGNGGKHTSYPALLYEMNASIARTVTPLEFASMSPTTIANSKVLLLSSSGKNIDVAYAIKRAMKYCPDSTAGFTFVDNPAKNKMIGALKPENIFCFKNPYTDGFISIRSKIFTYGLLYKAFSGAVKFSDKLNFIPRYDYFINREGVLPELGNIKHFILLYGSYGEPVAHDIESTMVEGGIASVQVCDYRNFCHGRFIFASNHCQSKRYAETDACVIMLTTPREAKIAEYLRDVALPANMPIVQIHTELQSSLATIQLLLDSLHFVFDMAENHCGINPNSPHNFSGVDKRFPISQVRFVSTLKECGELKYEE